jgi:hypothetical protein
MTKLEAVKAQPEDAKTARKKQEGRSPSYPGIPLGEAITRARTIYERDGRNSAPVTAILGHWGYKDGSGPGTIALAALKKFGLLTDEGVGPKRTAKLTELALRIVLDTREDSPERAAFIREAALKPSIHAELWRECDGKVPSDGTLRHKLVLDRKFTQRGADEFIQQFRSTIAFSGLNESDSISDEDGEKDADQNAGGSKTPSKPKERKPMAGVREEAFTLDEGQAVLTWPLNISPESAEDLEAWLNLIIKKAKRISANAEKELGHEPEDPSDG